ncbi:MAG: SdrD B-like domain-containing protein, partial [Chloroflexota bacterium]
TPTPSSTPQTRSIFHPSGPELNNFQPGFNPLTGLQIEDPSLLDLPAVLVSISNMPPTARPQAGISFVPWIYEMFIGEGTTRFMGVFYGNLPRRIPYEKGDCSVKSIPDKPKGAWIGNRVWLDENANGIQDPWESGVGGICISLFDPFTSNILAVTSSDSDGYYAFDSTTMMPGSNYFLSFNLPGAYAFTKTNVGNDDQDSDADQKTGRINFSFTGKTDSSFDTGLVTINPGMPVFSSSDIAPNRTYVGPIRSGRLTYNDLTHMYPASCLIYASAGQGIREQLDGCEIIFGEQPGVSPNTALLDVDHLLELAQKSKVNNQPVNYSGNLFDQNIPAGGETADTLWTFFHAYSQAFWIYDEISGSYVRQTDDGDGNGVFHIDKDRLTNRTLRFENVVIIFANYQVFRHGQYDIDLCCGYEGYAFLFRDGQIFKIRWSSNNREWEKTTGLLRPLHLTGADKQSFPLKPGRTWVSIMTPNSAMRNISIGNWQALFAMPDDTAQP